MIDTVFAVLLIGVQNDFRIGASRELISFAYQFLSELDVVENLAIECDPQLGVSSGHWLRTALQIDYAQPGMGQSGGTRHLDTARIWSAVAKCRNHLAELTRISLAMIELQ